jgi:tyrosinase
MVHTLHPDALDHPETFDEVIAEGFPHDRLEALATAHRERLRARRPVPRAARLIRTPGPAETTIREDQARLSPAKQVNWSRKAHTSS